MGRGENTHRGTNARESTIHSRCRCPRRNRRSRPRRHGRRDVDAVTRIPSERGISVGGDESLPKALLVARSHGERERESEWTGSAGRTTDEEGLAERVTAHKGPTRDRA